MTALATDLERAREALWALDSGTNRHEWVRIGCAAKAAGLAFEDFNDWSSNASNYGGAGDSRRTWESFKEGHGINAGTLFHLARQSGWADPANDNRQVRVPRTSAPILEWWENAVPATPDHPYIVKKWGLPEGLRMVSHGVYGWGKHRGKDLSGWLIVPVRAEDGSPVSLQFIGPDGSKLNAFGRPMAGTFIVGELSPGKPAYIVEGIGHAWSLFAVTGDAAVVSFGASNIGRAAAAINQMGSQPIIVADRGQEAAAAAAATRHQCSYVALPEHLPDGADVNDLHQQDGEEAVLAAIANLVTPSPANDNGGQNVSYEERRRQQKADNKLIQDLRYKDLPPLMTLDDMLRDCVWIASGGQVGRLSNPQQIITFKEFADLTAASKSYLDNEGIRLRHPTPIANQWKQHSQRTTVDTRTFHPGEDVICFDPDGARALNSWRPIERRPAKADISAFLEQICYLFEDSLERETFLDWLAHIEQRPGVLPHYGWLHIAARTGTGRNWLASVLARVWRGYVAPNVDLPALLESQFNGQLAGRILAIVDEIQEGAGENPYRHFNKLKSLVNAENRDLNPKYARQYRERNACRWLVFSNHDNALPLNDTDRRWRVVKHVAAPRDSNIYQGLYKLLDDSEFINAVGVYLNDRDITKFNPGQRPPMNDAKLAAVGASKSLTQIYAEELVGKWPADIVTNGDAAQVLSDGDEKNLTPAMRRALEELGAKSTGTMHINGRSARGWILRNAQRWQGASNAVLATEVARARGCDGTLEALDVLGRRLRTARSEDPPF